MSEVKVGHINTMGVCGGVELQAPTFTRWRQVVMRV